MSNKVIIIIVSIFLLLLLVCLFVAGYERGIYVTQKNLALNSELQNKESNSVQGEIHKIRANASEVANETSLPNQNDVDDKKNTRDLITDQNNTTMETINFEFNKSLPLIVSKGPQREYSLDSIVQEIINNGGGTINIADVESIKSEIFVYVGTFKEAEAISLVEFLFNMGYKARIIHKTLNNNLYSFVVVGPFVLLDNATKFFNYIVSKGHKFAKLII